MCWPRLVLYESCQINITMLPFKIMLLYYRSYVTPETEEMNLQTKTMLMQLIGRTIKEYFCHLIIRNFMLFLKWFFFF